MPSTCLLSKSGRYAVRHNPAAYYTNITRACQSLDVPLGSTPNVSARFTFVTPNLCNDIRLQRQDG
jgi:phosphatidylinositol-3-phosphatase